MIIHPEERYSCQGIWGWGAVYSCSRKALILTLGIEKEAQILQVSFHGSFTPGMALRSSHYDGVLSWQVCHSSHIYTSEIGGSDG